MRELFHSQNGQVSFDHSETVYILLSVAHVSICYNYVVFSMGLHLHVLSLASTGNVPSGGRASVIIAVGEHCCVFN